MIRDSQNEVATEPAPRDATEPASDVVVHAVTAEQSNRPTLWGLAPVQIHDRFWAARGVQVVRRGERSEIVRDAELFLLTGSKALCIFRISHLVDQLSWLTPELMVVRLHEAREHGYREFVVTDDDHRFVRFDRVYGASDSRMARVGLTPSRFVAEMWQNAPESENAWSYLRRRVPRSRRTAMSVDGNVYDRTDDREVMQCLRDLVQVWRTPDATIRRARRLRGDVWADRETQPDSSVQFIGPAWVGAGREQLAADSVVGPAILWDDPEDRPEAEHLEWLDIEPVNVLQRPLRVKRQSSLSRVSKRLFDIAFASLALLLILPIFPLVMLAIWIEDGRPFFFAHRRETMGGKEFPCIKFRSMRNDADAVQKQIELKTANKADGPQFFIDPNADPRLTRVGRIIRKLNIDELPQFINVLLGHMSVVGPRPSPRRENQFSPEWREARLSVRPGVTGLWQIMRTRAPGMDFQEWIKYDIHYVENLSWSLDLWIIWKTILIMTKLGD